ncbi:PilN domain-containing protein [Calderihabitans maritimus]|uniref:Fimbrial assembly protein PilN n=1 Tax=Calderihabitans maritimus TaxID=1246530 RepID=A0A1Z5HXX8_9FIRM|nr:PilN domain-containing protein [Calderihabitans maritimus]GAW94140.1 fimbrial assembly protein PilN [Calderihabitans maritimus]
MDTINLLPAELRRRQEIDWKRVGWLAGIAVLLFVLVSAYLVFLLTWWSNERQLKRLELELDGLRPKVLQVQKMQQEIKDLEEKVASLEEILKNRIQWNRLLSEINERMPEDLWITEMTADEKGVIIIKGKASSLTSVGVFIFQLKQIPYFNYVGLVSGEEKAAEAVVEYEISVRLAERRSN